MSTQFVHNCEKWSAALGKPVWTMRMRYAILLGKWRLYNAGKTRPDSRNPHRMRRGGRRGYSADSGADGRLQGGHWRGTRSHKRRRRRLPQPSRRDGSRSSWQSAACVPPACARSARRFPLSSVRRAAYLRIFTCSPHSGERAWRAGLRRPLLRIAARTESHRFGLAARIAMWNCTKASASASRSAGCLPGAACERARAVGVPLGG